MSSHKSSKSINIEVKEIGSYDDYFEHGDKDIEWTPAILKYRGSTKTLIIQKEVSGEKTELKLKLVIGVTSMRKEEDEGADDVILFLKLLNANKEDEYLNIKIKTCDSNWQTMFIKFLGDLCPHTSPLESPLPDPTIKEIEPKTKKEHDKHHHQSSNNETNSSQTKDDKEKEKESKRKKKKTKDSTEDDTQTKTKKKKRKDTIFSSSSSTIPTLSTSNEDNTNNNENGNNNNDNNKDDIIINNDDDKDTKTKKKKRKDTTVTQPSSTTSSSEPIEPTMSSSSSSLIEGDDVKTDKDTNEPKEEKESDDKSEKSEHDFKLPSLSSAASTGGISVCSTPRSDGQLIATPDTPSDGPSLAPAKRSKSGFHLRSIFSRNSLKKNPTVVATTGSGATSAAELSPKNPNDVSEGSSGSVPAAAAGRRRIGRSGSIFSRSSKITIPDVRSSVNASKCAFVPPPGDCNLFGEKENDEEENGFGRPIPYKVAFAIFEYLSLRDLAQCTRVNKAWHEIAEYPHLWFQKCFALGLDVSTSLTTDKYKSALCTYRKKICRQLTLAPEGHNSYPRELYQSILNCKARDVNPACMNGIINIKSGRRTKKRWLVLVKGCLVIYKSKKSDEIPISIIPLNGRVFAQVLGSVPSVMSYSSSSSATHSYSSTLSMSSTSSQSHQYQSQAQHYSVHSASPSDSSFSNRPASVQSSVSPPSASPMLSVSIGSPRSPAASTPATPSRLSAASGVTSAGLFSQSGKHFYFRLDGVISYCLDGDSSVKENPPESWIFYTESVADTNEWVSVINSGIETFSQLIPTAVIVAAPPSDDPISVVATKLLSSSSSSSSSASTAAAAYSAGSPSPRPTIASTTPNGAKEAPKKPIFGKTIDEIMDRQMEEGTMSITPDFLHAIFSRLEKTSTEVEGIFRISGSEQEVTFIRDELESGRKVDFTMYSPHTLTSFVKAFFKSLPEPIIPPKLNKVLDNTLKKAEFESKELPDDYCEMINQTLVNKLSMSSMALLKELVRLFNKIVEKSSINKMTLDNLFIVILPTLQCAPSVLAAMMAKPDAILGSDLFGSSFM